MGLKREAGVNPAWSRHCNWCDPSVRVAQSLAHPKWAGKARGIDRSQEPGDLPSGVPHIRFAEGLGGILNE